MASVCAKLMNTGEIIVLLGFSQLGAVIRFGYKDKKKKKTAVCMQESTMKFSELIS